MKHDPHILYTLSALQVLALYNELSVVDADLVVRYVASLQQSDGSFSGDQWGEIDTRFSYCALSILSILGQLDSPKIDMKKAIDFVARLDIRRRRLVIHISYGYVRNVQLSQLRWRLRSCSWS